ncbi:MAG: CapA family protein, partial [Anaerolineae bacterium]|nr:CapA family protein [Anaerolineae bacterium]
DFKTLQSFWKTGQTGLFNQSPLLMDLETRRLFEKLWGSPDEKAVQTVETAQLLETAWAQQPSWAIVPFEALEPRWKVLRVDQVSPLDKEFDPAAYPLTLPIGISGTPQALQTLNREADGALFAAGNRNAEHMTSLMLTGTTALVRYMAERMEEHGVLYPATDIKKVFDGVDITHISNEVPFYEKCPPAKPVRREMRFCSDPKYFELLQDVGMDVVELTGNHILDWGVDPLLYTIDLYDREGIKYYGGGRNDSDARKPLIIEDHGNRLGFIGCSPAGPTSVWATGTQPGSAKCDFDYIKTQIEDMRADGIIPIFTFQHYESDDYRPTPMQRPGDFHMVSEMGAAIVSGSQSHFPQAMTFDGSGFIHYGLGNTFFDQMDDYHRMAFLDRHVFFEGRYIGTELITIILEDYARPREMTSEERRKFLQTVFADSDWGFPENK